MDRPDFDALIKTGIVVPFEMTEENLALKRQGEIEETNLDSQEDLEL